MNKKLKRRQEIDLEIEKVAFGGQGIGHIDDFVVFVENCLPGDIVTARVRKARKQYAQAYPVALIKPSPLRQSAPCEHFGHCGGCKWQNISYEQQLIFKKAHVLESLSHIGGIVPEVIRDTLPAGEIFGYRNKMEFSFTDNRWLTPEELKDSNNVKGFALGLHLPRFFDRILDVNFCHIQSKTMNKVLQITKSYFASSGVSVYNLRRHEGILRHLVLRQSFANNSVLVNVVSYSPIVDPLNALAKVLTGEVPEVSGIVNTINNTPAQVATGNEIHTIWGVPHLREKIGPYEFEISPGSFFQTNSLQAEELYRIIKRFLDGNNGLVWDLYCGAGTIAMYIADCAEKVRGFEIVESSVTDARRNAKLNEINNCEFVAGDLSKTLGDYISDQPEAIICDPPRAGMHKNVVKMILDIVPSKIIYVSCNPTTMARDLSTLKETYIVSEVQPVDMFPHTYHIETVVKMIKR